MEKQRLKEVVIDQKEVFLSKKGLIDRNITLDRFLTTSQIVVITGVRRCGKSSLMYLIKDALDLKENQFCYCNFDDERIIYYPDLLSDIYAIHIEQYQTKPIFFFDEIQEIPNWQKFVNRMYEQSHKLFVTGSNATLLSSEISTSLTGRNRILELYPFSFEEYLRLNERSYEINRLSVKQKALIQSDLNQYLELGGFPLVVKEKDLEVAHALFQDILYRDIVIRYQLSNVEEIKKMALFLASNIGKLFSYSTLQSVSELKSLSSVKNYLQYLESSHIFYYLKKFDYSVKKQILNSRKVYAIDNAIPNRLGFRFSENLGRLLENVVFIEMKRRGKEIYYYQNKYECDFLIKENLKIIEAIQVVYSLNRENSKRELNGVLETMHTFSIPKGTIIVMDKNKFSIELPENISIMSAYEWLLTNTQNN